MKTLVTVVAIAFFAATLALAADKPRVFITDSKSWEMSGSIGGSSGGFASSTSGGARPQTAEIIKTFGERFPDVQINNQQAKADYIVLLDHEGAKGWVRKDNKVAVFNRAGDSIVSRSTRSLGNAVEDACMAILGDWARHGATPAAEAAPANPPPAAAATAATPAASATPASGSTRVQLASVPDGADVEVDGSYVGNTPSVIELAPGEHTVAMKKSGYQPWQRKIKTSGGSVNVRAELEKAR